MKPKNLIGRLMTGFKHKMVYPALIAGGLGLGYLVGCSEEIEPVPDMPKDIIGTWQHSVTWYEGYAISWVGDNIEQFMEFHENGAFEYYGNKQCIANSSDFCIDVQNLNDSTYYTSNWSYENDTLKIKGVGNYYDLKFSNSKKSVLFMTYTNTYSEEEITHSLNKR